MSQNSSEDSNIEGGRSIGGFGVADRGGAGGGRRLGVGVEPATGGSTFRQSVLAVGQSLLTNDIPQRVPRALLCTEGDERSEPNRLLCHCFLIEENRFNGSIE